MSLLYEYSKANIMKCINKFLLLVLIFVSLEIKAQDWQCVHEGVTTTFVDTSTLDPDTQHTAWVVHIDSVRVYQGWNYHYGFQKLRFVSFANSGGTYYSDYCYDPHGPSRMGVALSALGGENFFFNSAGHGIRISTLRQPDQPWICCGLSDTSLLYATITSMDVETIFGEPDSVKYISFQAKSNAGALLPHPMNTQVFVLSKHFGMITLFDFYEFPNYTSDNPVHWLTGIKTPGKQTGDQNLTYADVYSYAPGDIFHTIEGGTHPNVPIPETISVLQILDSTWNSGKDTVTYKISRYARYRYYNTSYWRDTISISYAIHSSNCLGIDNFPEQTIFCIDTNGILKSVNSFEQFKDPYYNSRWTKYQKYRYSPGLYCADTLVGIHIPALEFTKRTDHYVAGCGGPYFYSVFTDWSHKTSTLYYRLLYFKKGSDTWGTPINTTNWDDPNAIPDTAQVRIILYPNPSNDQVTLEIPGTEKTDYRLEIFSLSGIKIREMNFTENKFTFSISAYQQGIYFLKLYEGNLQIGQEKLIKY